MIQCQVRTHKKKQRYSNPQVHNHQTTVTQSQSTVHNDQKSAFSLVHLRLLFLFFQTTNALFSGVNSPYLMTFFEKCHFLFRAETARNTVYLFEWVIRCIWNPRKRLINAAWRVSFSRALTLNFAQKMWWKIVIFAFLAIPMVSAKVSFWVFALYFGYCKRYGKVVI